MWFRLCLIEGILPERVSQCTRVSFKIYLIAFLVDHGKINVARLQDVLWSPFGCSGVCATTLCMITKRHLTR